MKNIIIYIMPLFIFLVSCNSQSSNNQREYNVTLKRSRDTILINYKLDSSYQEIQSGLDLWATEDAKKYKKNNEITIRFYNVIEPIVNESYLKKGADIEMKKYGISENPFATVEEYSTKFNNHIGYIIKSQSKDNRFILSFYTYYEDISTSVRVVMEGGNLKKEDESIFFKLIESFSFQKK